MKNCFDCQHLFYNEDADADKSPWYCEMDFERELEDKAKMAEKCDEFRYCWSE
jgi:hypothetical protein